MTRAIHVTDPDAPRYDGRMLYRVYDDGEVTLTPAGLLWGLRSEHTICYGVRGIRCVDEDLLPGLLLASLAGTEATGYRFVIVEESEAAMEVRATILVGRAE
jgi:hypothetical protein